MNHFQFVSKKEAEPCKKELIEIIKKAQNEVRDKFNFKFNFISSSKRNMN
ncbi:MAG: hypothetical protein HDT13_04370 [Butyrivibrio sp.]|nr:hypothetical protein [Butyrivibrio sp.]